MLYYKLYYMFMGSFAVIIDDLYSAYLLATVKILVSWP